MLHLQTQRFNKLHAQPVYLITHLTVQACLFALLMKRNVIDTNTEIDTQEHAHCALK